jgi:hypothetical protein
MSLSATPSNPSFRVSPIHMSFTFLFLHSSSLWNRHAPVAFLDIIVLSTFRNHSPPLGYFFLSTIGNHSTPLGYFSLSMKLFTFRLIIPSSPLMIRNCSPSSWLFLLTPVSVFFQSICFSLVYSFILLFAMESIFSGRILRDHSSLSLLSGHFFSKFFIFWFLCFISILSFYSSTLCSPISFSLKSYLSSMTLLFYL